MQTQVSNVSIITMDNDQSFLGDILINGDKIIHISQTAVNTTPELDNHNDQITIDGSGLYAMPALFDMHVHLNSTDMMPLFIANGVTSVRNMWGFPIHLEWIKQIENGERISPYIYTTGPLTDGLAYWPGSKIVTTEDEAERAVLDVIAQGYRYYKTYPSIPKDAYLKILEVAKAHNFKVCGHGSNYLSWKTLADFGYYCCEHTGCLPADRSDIEYMAKSGMWLCPTHVVEKTIEDYVYKDSSFDDCPYIEYVSPRNRKDWEDVTHWRRTNGRYKPGSEFPMAEYIARTKVFIEHAGTDKILLGTDTSNPGVTAGFTIADELRYLVEIYGLTRFEALKSGTVNGAIHLGIEDKKGKLKVGYDADILLLRGNPLEDITNASKIEAVMQGGKLFNRTTLDDMLEQARHIKDEDIYFVEDYDK